MPETRVEVSYRGVEEARRLFASKGLGLPPIPAPLAQAFRLRSAWSFASKPIRTWPYSMNEYVDAALSRTPRAYVLLAHAGHGVNSYALHYYLVQRPLMLFVQIGWGGAYMEKAVTTARVNECFRLCRELVACAEEAVSRRLLRPETRVPVVATDFRPRLNVCPPESLDMKRWSRRLRSDGESEWRPLRLVLSDSAGWFRSLGSRQARV